MKYKGYEAKIEYSDPDEVFFGTLLNINDVVTFEGDSVPELKDAFESSVDDYLAFCAENGREPEKPYSGKFHLRMPCNLHGAAALAAERDGQSLNEWINKAIREELPQSLKTHAEKREQHGNGF